MADRLQMIESLNNFVTSSKNIFDNVLEQLEWTKESIYTASEKFKSTQSSQDNMQLDLHNSESQNTNNNTTCEGVNNVPAASDSLYSDLVESLSKPSASKQDGKSREEILAEMLKLERDAKRRRKNYKNKVHTKNKSHLEILREVLAEQMSTLYDETNPEVSSQKTTKAEDSNKSTNCNLIEYNVTELNPHIAWKTIIQNSQSAGKLEYSHSTSEKAKDKHRYSDNSKLEFFESGYRSKDPEKNKYVKPGKEKWEKFSMRKFDDYRSRNYEKDIRKSSSSHGKYKNDSDRNKSKDKSRDSSSKQSSKHHSSSRHERRNKRSRSISPTSYKVKKHKSKHKKH